LCGVCAGVADFFGFRIWATRCLTILACIFFPPATVLIYIGVCLLVPPKPKELYKSNQEEVFWRSVRVDPHRTFRDVRHRFRDLDARLQRMERYVTSPRFDLDKEFRDLES
jgi:phage shock protein C